jgi:AAA ATPase domain
VVSSAGGNQVPSSAITDQDLEYLKGLAEAEASTTSTRVDTPNLRNQTAASYDSALKIAAFLGGFNPLNLILGASADDLRKLLKDCTASTDGHSSRWQLKATVRTRVLAQLAHTKDGLKKGAEQAELRLKSWGESPDAITSALIELASGVRRDSKEIAGMSRVLSAAYQAALGWFEWPTTTVKSAPQSLLADIKMEELFEPFRFLTGFNPVTGKDIFVGRETELSQLRSFVDILHAKNVFESAKRSISRVFRESSRAIFVSGIGGIGKSTLIAKFILQHVNSPARSQVIFAYLDFDRSTISAAQPATLLLELVRQLSWQAYKARDVLDELCSRVREEMNRTEREADGNIRGTPQDRVELPMELVGETALINYLSELNIHLSQYLSVRKPTVLVLDTFEEAQALGDEAVRRVEGFINLAMGKVTDLRVVIVGRDEAVDYFPGAERITLKEFGDEASRRALLEAHGVPRPITAQVAKEVGGRPLALLLAASLVKEHGAEAVAVSFGERFKGLFIEHLIEGVLYDRILSHIRDKDARKLAHPGLVLRRINSDIISRVIAPVLDLGEFPDDKCERVMEMLRRQKDLVRIDPDGSVRHRSDVREQMLVLMTAQQPEMVRKLHQAAIAYYVKHQESARDSEALERDRIEEIYHRLAVGESLERIPDLWFPKARVDLARSVDEISNPAGRGTLKIMLGRVPDSEEVKRLPSRLLTEFAVRSLRASITSGAPEKALTILADYGESIPDKVRETLKPLALDQAGSWDEASQEYLRLFEHIQDLALPDTLAVADFFERYDQVGAVREKLVRVLSRPPLEKTSLKMTLPISLAVLRLRFRLGQFEEIRASGREVIGLYDENTWPIADAPTSNTQWLVTLTAEVDRNGLRLFDGMPISDAVRNQVKYLSAILKATRRDDKLTRNAQNVCNVIGRSRKIDTLMGKQLEDQGRGRSVILVLRHIMRPSTPQWYIPLACTLRNEWGPEINVSSLYWSDLPKIPFEVSATLRSTKSVADLLGQFDQLGILQFTLDRILDRQPSLIDSKFYQIVDALRSWRVDMFPDLDRWIGSLLGIESAGNIQP